MAITDIFSSSFLFSVAIIIILIGGIFAYVSFRMGEQDNKLNAMIALIGTMAEESQFFRSKLNALQQKINDDETHDVHLVEDKTNKHISISSQQGGNLELIDVSDDDEADNEDDEDEANNDDDEDEDEDEELDNEEINNETDDDDEDEDEDGEEQDIPNHTIKILNLSLANDDINCEDEDIHEINFENNETKIIHLEQDALCEINMENIEELNEHKDSDIRDELKNISINANLGEEETDKTDYKKMNLTKLREIVVSKGLTNDAGKLKKNDILKLLEN